MDLDIHNWSPVAEQLFLRKEFRKEFSKLECKLKDVFVFLRKQSEKSHTWHVEVSAEICEMASETR